MNRRSYAQTIDGESYMAPCVELMIKEIAIWKKNIATQGSFKQERVFVARIPVGQPRKCIHSGLARLGDGCQLFRRLES